jgi:hypothetical protein
MQNKKLRLTRIVGTALAIMASSVNAQTQGGFIEDSTTAVARSALTQSQINSFMPDRGSFTFPSPYDTQGVRLTNASDCNGGDCVNYAGYSYWRNMNNHIGMPSMLIFIGLDRHKGGVGPKLFELQKDTGQVTDLGPLFPSSHSLSWATGEGWYFSATMPTTMYLNEGSRIVRFDVITEEMQTVVDLAQHLGAGYLPTQMQSSDNDRVHSATVRHSSNFEALGCMAYEEATQRYHYFPVERDFDECQVDRSGEWLLIKANLDGANGEDNLIINLKTGHQRVLLDRDGAAGHSDMGHGYMIAADNWASDANTWKLWDFSQSTLKGERVYHNKNWDVFAPAHLSHTNARAGLTPQQQFACGSSVNRGAGPHANEIVCFNLNGTTSTVVVAPTMTSHDAAGGGNDYARFSKGNLDVTGQYFLWTSNLGSSRLDAFIVRVPDNLLTGGGASAAHIPSLPSSSGYSHNRVPATSPALSPAAGSPSSSDKIRPDSILWDKINNVATAGDRITKTSGCDGCPDAGALSLQHIADGTASLEFVAVSYDPLLYAGFTRTQSLPTATDYEFSIRLQNGMAEVREGGHYRGDIPFNQGDRFNITVGSNQVEYRRNGEVFHTTSVSASYPLFVASTLLNVGAALDNVAVMLSSAPKISNLTTVSNQSGELQIDWTTDKPAENMVQSGTSSAYDTNSAHNTTLQTSHRVTLRNLVPGTRYHFRALVRDASGHISSSGDMLYTMPF